MNKENEKSKYKLSIIISIIGLVICFICLILEIFIIKESMLFWIILITCNLIILIGNLYQYIK